MVGAGDCFLGGEDEDRRTTMFGNPQWFRTKAVGFGLVPTSWQGWAYSAGWGGTIGLPFLLMLGRHQSLEALLWLVLSIGAMAYDVWKIVRAIRRPDGEAQCSARPAERVCCR